MTVDELKAAALRLAPQARADLARKLLSSLDELSEAEIEQLWFAEAARAWGASCSAAALSSSTVMGRTSLGAVDTC